MYQQLKQRIIFHIDMNCFYVSCEVAANPFLKGKKVAIGRNGNDRRGIILTASYEARVDGVKSAMRISDALDKCPELILVDPNMELYSEYSQEFFDYFLSLTPLVEPASIDEGYLDVTDIVEPQKAIELAIKIQNDLLEKFNLPCSIGIGPNKFLAKMASDMKKPLGITVLRKKEIKEKLWPLPIKEMTGIGRKTQEKFAILNIKTIGDLANYQDLPLLKDVIGDTNAIHLYHQAHGEGDNIVDVNRFTDITSVSNSQTLAHDEYRIENILLIIKLLTNVVANRLSNKALKATTITLQIKYSNFKTINRSKTLPSPTSNARQMFEILQDLFEEYYDSDYPVRLLGVATSKLVEAKEEIKQISIFDKYEEEEKDFAIKSLLKDINDQIGQDVIRVGVKNKQTGTDKYDKRWSDIIKNNMPKK